MQILATSIPARSHVANVLAVAECASSLGHEVDFMASSQFWSTEASVSWREASLERMPDPHLGSESQWLARQISNWPDVTMRSFGDAMRAIGAYRPDLLLRDFSDRGALLAAEMSGIPQIAVTCNGEGPLERPVEPHYWINDLRRELGLPESRSTADQNPGALLALRPREIYLAPEAVIPDLVFARFTPTRGEDGHLAEISDALVSPNGYVVVGMGTVVPEHVSEVHSWVASLVQHLDCDVVVLAGGRDYFVNRVGAHLIVGNGPQYDLLRGARAFVSHGGFNSCMEAALARVPTLFVPVFGDQYFNAQRFSYLGTGEWLSYRAVTPDVGRTVLRRLMCASERRSGDVAAANLRSPSIAEAWERSVTIVSEKS